MNKLVKGAIATGVGVVLLMGGAGSLAYWNAGTNLGGATITAGNLSVAPVGSGTWKNGAATISAIGSFRTVPGDSLTFTQDVTLTATGDNLKFTVGLAAGALTLPGSYTAPATVTNSTELKNQMLASASYSVAGSNISLVSPNTYQVATAGTTTITVTVTLAHAFQTGTVNNVSQNGQVVLGSNALTFAQV
jgi:alternate signal-mediated exported protein